MPPDVDIQPRNLNSILVGTGEFRFCEGYNTAAAALNKPFVDFGNLDAYQLSSKSTNKPIMGSYRGVRSRARTIVNELELMYALKSNEFRADILQFFLCGTRGSNYTQPIRVAADADTIPAHNKGPWYDLTVGGLEVRNLTAVSIFSSPVVVENVDYVIDYESGSLRWLVDPPGTITKISLTAPAITATNILGLKTITPLTTPVRRGMGRVLTFDKGVSTATDVVYDHKDFFCEVWGEGSPNIDGVNPVETTLNVNVLRPRGTVRTREQ